MGGPRSHGRSLAEIRSDYDGKLLAIDGVVGVGEGEEDGRPVYRVYVTRRTSDLVQRLPESVEGVPVRIEISGEFHAQ